MFLCSELKQSFSQTIQETSRIFSSEILIHFMKNISDVCTVTQGSAITWITSFWGHITECPPYC